MKKVKTTFHIRRDIYDAFAKYIKDFGIRRDTYLNRVLWGEVGQLKLMPPNSRKAREFDKALRGFQQDLKRVGMSLDADLIQALNKTCDEKRVARDAVLEAFLEFLVDGDPYSGSGLAPFPRISELLDDPRVDYYPKEGQSAYESLRLDDGVWKAFIEQQLRESKS